MIAYIAHLGDDEAAAADARRLARLRGVVSPLPGIVLATPAGLIRLIRGASARTITDADGEELLEVCWPDGRTLRLLIVGDDR
ncbi:hypothetical protein [Allonocardiopsis opalescens]|uniref:Uncharacterized protein n=1 Tax=Allonocardiopsis opalescens TaxID=1144618 RepID=A0A2T0PPI6_9ACTN|nr:hypothetical protein [Allonocardiopsis opalescens]PRX90811.1 hypothetical protein CLV72_1167 [Allonocardiopsis opalescens]